MPAKKVLIFDDDEDLLVIFSFLFEEDGWEVYTENTCDRVIENVRELRPDLILMDNWIPSIGGMAATQLLKKDQELNQVPVIYISANNDVEQLARKAGADVYMAKPFDFDELITLAHHLTNKS